MVLFCLTIHPLVSQLESALSIWYLDDCTEGDTVQVVTHDLDLVNHGGAKLSLQLNRQKSEVVGNLIAREAVHS